MKKQIVYLLAALMVAVTFSFCNKKNTKLPTNMNTEQYEAEWKEIQALENKGLPKSALEKVNALHAKVKKKNNQSQLVKCLIYKSKYMVQLEEDGYVKALGQMQKDMEAASFPIKQVLQSMLAEQYANYLQQNYWRINERTETPDFQTDDIRTWTVGQLTEESKKYYLLSIAEPQLKDSSIKNWDAITTKPQESDHLRPNLYDFLAHRAIDFLMNENNYLSEPAYKFYIEDKAAFADAATFADHNFETKDTDSKKYQTLRVFQQLTSAHLNDDQPNALIVLELKRLRFMKNNAVMDGKDELYLKALENLEAKYSAHGASTEILYEMAQHFYNKGNTYQPNPDDNGKFDLKIAYDLCEKGIQRLTDSHGAKLCKNLQGQILQKDLRVEMELVNVPNAPMLAMLNYRNVGEVHLKIAKVSESDRQQLERQQYDKMLPFLNKLKTEKEWTLQLPDGGDYREHRVEFKVDALPTGFYVLMVADDPGFTDKQHGVSYIYTHVSNISYWTRRDELNHTEFFVADRTSGEPLERVKVEFFARNYNQSSRKYDYQFIGDGYTDTDGYLKPMMAEGQNFKAKLTYGKDVLWLDDHFSNYRYRDNRQKYIRTELFTDRAIYRPGQTIYFKGMVVEMDREQMPSIVANRKVTITFKDANYQDINKLDLVTNEYGTVQGNFIAPRSGLLGSMTLQSDLNGQQRVQVEEYKRPKFEVTFNPVSKSYKVGEEVTISGNAKAFAGSNVDGAKVEYRVVRETIVPYWRYWSRYYPRPSSSQEITNGETITDADGKFNITFTALPDKTVDVKTKPQFNYRIYADVIDITGETHSNETNVSVGYIAMNVSIDVPDKIDRIVLAKKDLKISTKNLNGEFEPAAGTITVHALKTPAQTYRSRMWQKADMFLMSERDFRKDFPLDAFKNEDEIENWEVGDQVHEMNFDTRNKRLNVLPSSNWQVGGYVLTLNTQDKDGEKIELKKYFNLYDVANKKIPINLIQFHEIEKTKLEPGEVAISTIGTAEDEIKVLYEVEFDSKIINRKWLTVKDLETLRLNILEKHRGGIGYYLTFVKNNRFYNITQQIQVPWSNKDLKFEYSTFRDKLRPGQEEEWRIKISGPKKDKVAAEFVAAMYDASLDQFVGHDWYLNLYPTRYLQRQAYSSNFTTGRANLMARNWNQRGVSVQRWYRNLNWFGFSMYGGQRIMRSKMAESAAPMSAPPVEQAEMEMSDAMVLEDVVVEAANGGAMKEGEPTGFDSNEADAEKPDLSNVKVRTNLNETVFFFPEMKTDANGDVILKFTMNEALTRWKFLGMAHTKDLKFGLTNKEVVTQKELMVLPNAPRFVREGDEIEFTAKVSNLTKNILTGNAVLELYDALSMQSVDVLLENTNPTLSFTASAGQSARLAWKLKIPDGQVMALTHRVIAQAGDFSDGEESTLPVITNKMLVTETLPLPVRGNQTKDFNFDRMTSVNSSTLKHHKLTLEFTSNPAWYAVQALPYLMEYPYDCTEQIFNRYYANSLASNVANSHPKVKRIFESWKGTDALKSNLSKNQELKSALLEETPWVLAAQSEEEQKQNIGLLFDLNRMSYERAEAMNKIADRQLTNGGFSWFPGGRDSWYITQYIVEGVGHLEALGVAVSQNDDKSQRMITQAVNYIDARIVEYYEEISRRVKEGKTKWEDDHLNQMAIHYLYARSFFLNQQQNGKSQKVHQYFLDQAEKFWLDKGIYSQGMIALALHRNGKKKFTQDMIKSFKERALHSEELGMYWKYDRGYMWYQLPIETHALMIEVFDEVANDAEAVDDLKVWLLKMKQTTNWKTTKATAAAVYALLKRGANWLLEDRPVQITLGNENIDQAQMGAEAGTGYFKTTWDGRSISKDMGKVKVKNPNTSIAWGAMYWQYFEQLDKITTFEETPLKLNKKLFKLKNSGKGPVMTELKEGSQLQPGDKLKVRIELRVDRPMEYVHLKDMRASGFEPLNVLSQYKWQGGLGYYESTKDASTNFFISYLPKGTFVFEYPLVVNHKGDFSNGVTTIQCMYAPEFTSHSEGIRVEVN